MLLPVIIKRRLKNMKRENMIPPVKQSRWRRYLKRIYERFVKIRGDPHKIALGFSLGLFVGMSPSMGVQMPIAIFIAALLKWNKISSAAGVWITNPLTAPSFTASPISRAPESSASRRGFIRQQKWTSGSLKNLPKRPLKLFGRSCWGGDHRHPAGSCGLLFVACSGETISSAFKAKTLEASKAATQA